MSFIIIWIGDIFHKFFFCYTKIHIKELISIENKTNRPLPSSISFQWSSDFVKPAFDECIGFVLFQFNQLKIRNQNEIFHFTKKYLSYLFKRWKTCSPYSRVITPNKNKM
jgi:hypothetical protein